MVFLSFFLLSTLFSSPSFILIFLIHYIYLFLFVLFENEGIEQFLLVIVISVDQTDAKILK